MPKITLEYKYTQELQNQIYVERAERVSGRTEEFSDADLTPAAREAALTALTDWSDTFGRLLVTMENLPRSTYAASKAMNNGAIASPVTVGVEPTRSGALAEVERQLVAASKLAPAIITMMSQREREAAELAAQKRAVAIDAYLALPLDVWMDGKAPNRKLDNYKHNRPEYLPSATVELRKLDPRLNARAEQAAAEAERQNAAWHVAQAANQAALRAIVAADGALDQIERFDAGVLPKQELSALVKAHLFAPLAEFAEYQTISETAVAEECDCDTVDVRFSAETIEPHELEADEYATLAGIRKAAPAGADVEMRSHVGYQDDQTGEDDPEIRRYGIRVTIEFAGRSWSREYAMG